MVGAFPPPPERRGCPALSLAPRSAQARMLSAGGVRRPSAVVVSNLFTRFAGSPSCARPSPGRFDWPPQPRSSLASLAKGAPLGRYALPFSVSVSLRPGPRRCSGRSFAFGACRSRAARLLRWPVVAVRRLVVGLRPLFHSRLPLVGLVRCRLSHYALRSSSLSCVARPAGAALRAFHPRPLGRGPRLSGRASCRAVASGEGGSFTRVFSSSTPSGRAPKS